MPLSARDRFGCYEILAPSLHDALGLQRFAPTRPVGLASFYY